MSDKFDNIFNLTNYRDHPENKDFKVFFHYNMDQANHFKSLLDKESVEYELFIDEETDKKVMLFGVHKRYFRKALQLNDLSYAAFKKKFIPNSILRNSILVITVTLTMLAILGYIMSR